MNPRQPISREVVLLVRLTFNVSALSKSTREQSQSATTYERTYHAPIIIIETCIEIIYTLRLETRIPHLLELTSYDFVFVDS
jgi:hypothetical protein